MECTRWDEGLLITSSELPEDGKQSFENHAKECSFCRREMELYKRHKDAFFTSTILSELTSRELDGKILDACARLPRVSAALPISIYVRKVALSVLFLAIGFGGGVYFAFNFEDQQPNAYMANQNAQNQPTQSHASADVNENGAAEQREAALADASDDSIQGDSVGGGLSPRGNASMDGVVPVDLKEE
jgi:hypothetical protein